MPFRCLPCWRAPPPPPTPSYVFAAIGNGSLTASWQSVPGATKYHVTYKGDGGTWQLAASNHSSASITLNGIDYTKSYVVGVRAGNSGGWSGWKNSNPTVPWSTDREVTTPIEDGSRNKLNEINRKLRETRGGNWGLASPGPTAATYLAVTDVTHNGATLTIHHYGGAWSYKQDPGSCVNMNSGTTSIRLSGRTPETSYSYNAYPGSGCTGESMAFAKFTTTAAGVVTVSNLGEDASDAKRELGQYQNTNHRVATGFTAGSRSGGYTLQSVTVSIGGVIGTPTGFTAAIHTESGGNPAASATHTLTGSKPTASGLHTFTCSGSCDLSADTSYFLVLSATGPVGSYNFYHMNQTASVEQTNVPSDTDWAIADEGKYSVDGGSWTTTTNVHGDAGILMFKVTATEK